jgi:hypothetical protein
MARVKSSLALAGSVALLLAASQAGASELVTNGGFETGLTGWTEIGNWTTPYNYVTADYPYAGSYDLTDGNFPDSGLAGVQQQLGTVSGQSYDISVEWAANGTNTTSQQLYEVLWDGIVVGQINGDTSSLANGSLTYTDLTFTELGVGNDTIAVEGYSYSAGNFTDDISVTAAAAPATTPLPGALPLFASGLGAMGLLGWRRKKKAAAFAAA